MALILDLIYVLLMWNLNGKNKEKGKHSYRNYALIYSIQHA